MKREFSAGGIVFKGNQVLLTKHSQNKHWGFPKGWLDEGETSEQAAIREVREEGGVEAEIIDKVGYSKYVYFAKAKEDSSRSKNTHTLDGEKRFKVVTYFLMKYLSGNPKDHDFEMEDAVWFKIEEALKRISFSQDKILLKKALELKNR